MTTRTQNIRDMVWAHVYALRYERATAAGMSDEDAKDCADAEADLAIDALRPGHLPPSDDEDE